MASEKSKKPKDLSQYMALLSFRGLNHNDEQGIQNANQEFQFDHRQYKTDAWAGENDPKTLSGPYFGLPWEHQPKNGHSFVLGSLDPQIGDKARCSCDFQLADDNYHGISRRHIGVDIYERHDTNTPVSLRLTCIGFEMCVETLWPHNTDHTQGPTRIIRQDEFIPVSDDGCVAVYLRRLEFLIWVPKLTPAQQNRRRGLANEFAINAHKNLPTHFPSVTAGVDTVRSSVRVGSLSGLPWTSLDPISTAEEPFFEVYQGKHLRSAWKPILGPDTPVDIVIKRETEMGKFCTISAKLPMHPNVYRFQEIGRILTGNVNRSFESLPWAIGDYVPSNTKTLDALLRKTSSGEPQLDPSQKLSVFQQLCSAFTHAHRNRFAHGQLNGSFILAVEPQNSEMGKDNQEDQGSEETHPAVIIKVFGFRVCDSDVIWELAVVSDTRILGQLAVLLLGGSDVPDPYPSISDRWWMNTALRSDILVRPVLVSLLKNSFTVENAMHLIGGILQDQLATSNFTESLRTRKRAADALLPPRTLSKRIRPADGPDIVASTDHQSHTVNPIAAVSKRQGLSRSAIPAVRAEGVTRTAVSDDKVSQTSQSSPNSTGFAAQISPLAVISERSTNESTGELSLPAHPTQEGPAIGDTALPSLPGASPLQHNASSIVGLPTLQASLVPASPKMAMGDAIPESRLQREEGENDPKTTTANAPSVAGSAADNAGSISRRPSDDGSSGFNVAHIKNKLSCPPAPPKRQEQAHQDDSFYKSTDDDIPDTISWNYCEKAEDGLGTCATDNINAMGNEERESVRTWLHSVHKPMEKSGPEVD